MGIYLESRPRIAPGQKPLTDIQTIETLRKRFNQDAGKTRLMILFTTHRYDSIRRAHNIVVLVDGKLAEVGAPEELERKAGGFWSLYFGQGSQLGSVGY